MFTTLNPHVLRLQFPSLQQEINGQPALFLDGPGGTQTPLGVMEAISDYLLRDNSNQGGRFATSQRTDALLAAARQAAADFLNAARPQEIVFGPNMTSLTFHFSRALSQTWQAGDEIIVTRLDHDANISPWLLAARDRGVTVRWLDFHAEDCTLALEELPHLLTDKTRLVAVTYASNAVGSITDVARVVRLAQAAGAQVYVDAVHYAPHGAIDVQALECDYLVCSPYKFFGPHSGILYGKHDRLESLAAYKVRPAANQPPGKWETGTPNFESIAGIRAAIHYLATIGELYAGPDLPRLAAYTGVRRQLKTALHLIQQHESALSLRFLAGAAGISGLRVYGITDIERLDERTPTFAVSLAGYTPPQLAQKLADQGIFVWDGHYYAVAVMERLGLLDQGGLVRIGFVHYNTTAEVDRLLQTLKELAQ